MTFNSNESSCLFSVIWIVLEVEFGRWWYHLARVKWQSDVKMERSEFLTLEAFRFLSSPIPIPFRPVSLEFCLFHGPFPTFTVDPLTLVYVNGS